ncbi:MAG: DUF1810 domain-containing protein [Rhizomicrobium sp.]
MSDDPFHLARFIKPQNAAWPQVAAELAAGRKRSHWIWFVFPQVAGLGASPRTLHFAIASRAEALAYLAHEALGPRLREAVRLMLAVENQNALDVLGTPDDLKFRSSMTLFDAVAPNDIFAAALKKYFNGEGDARTVLNLAESQL